MNPLHRRPLLRLSAAAITLLLSLSAVGETVERQASSTGPTAREAVANALVEALQQSSGVKIDHRQLHDQVTYQFNAQFGDREVAAATLLHQRGNRLDLKSAGVISGYDVLSLDADDKGLFHARVKATIERYTPPGFDANNRRKLAVLPFRFHLPLREVLFLGLPPHELSRRFQQALVTDFTQSRRFSIMDRDFSAEYADERRLLDSPDAALSEYAKLGEVLGVDYLVVGTITAATLREKRYRIPVVDELASGYEGRLRAEYRVIVMATRQVKWADAIEWTVTPEEGAKKLGDPADATVARDRFITAAAAELSRQVIDHLYPPRVIAVNGGGEFVINQGGVTLHRGERFEVFSEGREFFDPYTHESLGRQEQRLGLAEIRQVDAKTSVARMVEGPRDVPEGALLRKPREASPISTDAKGAPAKPAYRPAF
ncbi:CsgG/HfaB family protein [Endothiovibrio diazotrophicus]